MPPTPSDLYALLCEPREALSEMFVALEEPMAMPNQSSRTTAVQFRNFGRIEGVLAATGLAVTLVSPAKWKRDLGLLLTPAEKYDPETQLALTPSRLTTARKRKALKMARELWPDAWIDRTKDDGRAEALLLAEWLRRRTCQTT